MCDEKGQNQFSTSWINFIKRVYFKFFWKNKIKRDKLYSARELYKVEKWSMTENGKHAQTGQCGFKWWETNLSSASVHGSIVQLV